MPSPNKNGSLGRGLGELIGGIPSTIGSAATISSTGFVRLSPDLIGLPPEREARAQNVSPELVESVRVHGILQPILVRRRTQGYEVVVGARRLVAARLAGVKEIPAVIVQVTDEEAGEFSKIENTCRENEDSTVIETEPAKVTIQKRCWTPAKLVMTCVTVLLLLSVGAGVGFWLGRGENAPALSGRVSAPEALKPEPVAQSVPAVEVPITEQTLPALEASDLKALEGAGLNLLMESNGMARIIFDHPLFTSRAALADEGTDLLKKLGAILAKHDGEWVVEVTGHTDAIPLRGRGVYKDNKELGLARAVEVTRYLMREAGVPSTMLRAATSGEVNPPYPGEDAESARKNRTVTLAVRLRE